MNVNINKLLSMIHDVSKLKNIHSIFFYQELIQINFCQILWYYLFSRCLNFAESRQETIPRGLNFAHAPGREI